MICFMIIRGTVPRGHRDGHKALGYELWGCSIAPRGQRDGHKVLGYELWRRGTVPRGQRDGHKALGYELWRRGTVPRGRLLSGGSGFSGSVVQYVEPLIHWSH